VSYRRSGVGDERLLADDRTQVPGAQQHIRRHESGHTAADEHERCGGHHDQRRANEHDPALAEPVDRLTGRNSQDQRHDGEARRQHPQPDRRDTEFQRPVGGGGAQHEGDDLHEDRVRQENDELRPGRLAPRVGDAHEPSFYEADAVPGQLC
jgi:hypothetical protein